MANKLSDVTKTLSEREKLSAIFWLILGILQCCTFVGVVSGAWNIYVSVLRFKNAEAVKNPWPGIVQWYEGQMTNIIIAMVINVVFGGVIGVAAALFDLFAIRGYAIENKQVFEDAGL